MKQISMITALLLTLALTGCGDKEAGSDAKIYPATGQPGGSSDGRRVGTPGASTTYPKSDSGSDGSSRPATTG